MAEMPDVISGETIESEWGNDIRDRTIQRYATVAERSSLNATPTEGDLSYREDTGQVDVYYSGAWRPLTGESITGGDVNTGGIGTLFDQEVGVAFTPPAYWNTYVITAWATLGVIPTGGGNPDCQAYLDINGNNSTAYSQASAPISVFHRRTNQTGTIAIRLFARRQGAGTASHESFIAYTATRST